MATFRPRRQARDRPALIRSSAAKVRLAGQPVGSGLAEICCDTAIPKKSKLATKQRQTASASKLLNVQKRRIVAVGTRICPRSGEFVAVPDPCIRPKVAPDFRPKLACERLFRRSHLNIWGRRERASRRKSGSESEDIEGARHRTGRPEPRAVRERLLVLGSRHARRQGAPRIVGRCRRVVGACRRGAGAPDVRSWHCRVRAAHAGDSCV